MKTPLSRLLLFVLPLLVVGIVGALIFTPSKTAIVPLPSQVLLAVPFTAQAPTDNWTEPWENACEETSIYMVNQFYQGKGITQADAVKQIREILQTKNKTFKVSADESMETVAALVATLQLPWSTHIIENPTVDQLKQELVQRHPVIVPVYAPSLWSKTYQGGGPDYHVMVLLGYDDTRQEFITNDPGTDSGQNQRFSYQLFMNAIHDLNQKDYQAGRKAVLGTGK